MRLVSTNTTNPPRRRRGPSPVTIPARGYSPHAARIVTACTVAACAAGRLHARKGRILDHTPDQTLSAQANRPNIARP